MAEMASSRHLHTPVASTYGIDHARAAYAAYAERTRRGRIVLSFPET
jgi:NADPH:quinone reductase-like Zn-dependent oxidoreductase